MMAFDVMNGDGIRKTVKIVFNLKKNVTFRTNCMGRGVDCMTLVTVHLLN